MLKRIFSFSLVMAMVYAGPIADVFEIDIAPEEAQQYINKPPYTEPSLSGKTAELPLVRWNDPRFRSAESGPTNGHYWKNGKEIENTDDYVEEVYDANQYHGQDGLGKYAFGYQGPDSARVENRQQTGEIAGSYVYRDANDQLIKVRYWADNDGFHQEDNLPKPVLPEAPQETPEVREARLAHEKAWNEAAAAAQANPDKGEYNGKYDYEHSASETQEQRVEPLPAASDVREARAYKVSSQSKSSYSSSSSSSSGVTAKSVDEEEEPTGPPRGFFYSFNYPVSNIVAKNARSKNGQQYNIDKDTVGVTA